MSFTVSGGGPLSAALYFGVALGLADRPDDTCVIRVEGDLDPAVAPAFEATMAAAEVLSAGDLVIDLDAVGFVGVAGARAITRAVDRVHTIGRRVSIERAPRTVQRLLLLVHEQDEGMAAARDPAAEGRHEELVVFAQSLQTLVPDARAVSVTSAGPDGLHTLVATGPLALELDQLQYDAERGPCVEAATLGRNSALADTDSHGRWPELIRAAERRGVSAVVSTPLLALASGLALNMYFRGPVGAERRDLVHDLVAHAVQVRAGVAT